MTEHNRRKGYWQYYETAKEVEQSHLKRDTDRHHSRNSVPA